MPISHELKTIFVHIPKTAGTSMETALGMHGEKDFIGIKPYPKQKRDNKHLFGQDMQHWNIIKIKDKG